MRGPQSRDSAKTEENLDVVMNSAMLRDGAPYLLIEGTGSADGARLYRSPSEIVEAATMEEVCPALERVRLAVAAGRYAAGFLAYEAGAALEQRCCAVPLSPNPLLWFGLFDQFEAVTDVAALLPDGAEAWIGKLTPEISFEDYHDAFMRLKGLIEAGNLYQANLSFRAELPVIGAPEAIYARLRTRAAAPHCALVDTGAVVLASLSPELFFDFEAHAIVCRPMKGTARRQRDPADDAFARENLRTDAKQRAENLMIVDLLRNDISRVSEPGSVKVPRLFSVESYPTVHQLTSTITGQARAGIDAIDVLKATFPCGSITGAPKIAAMQAIAALERGSPRGPYTGSIGFLDPDGRARFNVAIRTLVMPPGGGRALLGLGGGIVADSEVTAEWDEALAKGDFAAGSSVPPTLIETMSFDPNGGIAMLGRHLGRMMRSAQAFGYAFDPGHAEKAVLAAVADVSSHRRIRLSLSSDQTLDIEVSCYDGLPSPLAVEIVPLPVSIRDFRLLHTTGDRTIFEEAREASTADEVVFVRPDGLLTEGSFTSLFVARRDGLVTPPIDLGLLPGILREELVETRRAVEGHLVARDLAGPFFMGNALRGLMPARLCQAGGTSTR